MAEKPSEFVALERAIAPFAEGFGIRSGEENGLCGVYLHREGRGGKPEIGVFAGLLRDAGAHPHLDAHDGPEALVMAYVRPVRHAARQVLVEAEEAIFRTAHATLMPIASPEPFELYESEIGALVRRRRLPDGADSLSDRRLLEFCRGSLALLGQASLLDTLRQFDFVKMTVPAAPTAEPEK